MNKVIFTLLALCWLTACQTSQQRTAVNTLFTIGSSVDATYKGYLDLVVTGRLPTNSVPVVSQSYAAFQVAFNAAIIVVAHNTNAFAPTSVINAAATVATAVESAKKGTP